MLKILYQLTGILKIVAMLIIYVNMTVFLGFVGTAVLTTEIIRFLDYYKQNGLIFKNSSIEKDNAIKWGIILIVFYALVLMMVAIFKKSAFMESLYLIVVLTGFELVRVAIYIISKKRTGRQ